MADQAAAEGEERRGNDGQYAILWCSLNRTIHHIRLRSVLLSGGEVKASDQGRTFRIKVDVEALDPALDAKLMRLQDRES
jgi:hypothetical protein